MKKKTDIILGRGCVIIILIGIIVSVTTYIIIDRKTKKLEKELEKSGYVKDPNVNQIYPEPWRKPTTEELGLISIALSNNYIRGCGEFWIRKNIKETNEYLVACTANGERWEYYLVWPLTGDAMSTRGLDIKDMHLLKAPY